MTLAAFAAGAVMGCLVGAVFTAAARHDRERAIDVHAFDQGHAAGWVDGVEHEQQRRAAHLIARPHLTVVASERRN